jgi:hypothetical protein
MRTEIVYEMPARHLSGDGKRASATDLRRRGGAATKKRNIYHGDTEKSQSQSQNLNTEDTGEASEDAEN